MKHWFDKAIIYQVYPKSFNDTNNDGIGDIKGVTDKIPYLKKLGVNTLWLNPIYISPQVDNGYDVSNYFAVDSSLGTMEDMENLIEAAHNNNLKIVMDFVMNHTSDQHPWFQDAINNPHSIYRNYYLWSKGKNGKKPNNWGSFFGGSVWTKDPGETDEYYFHLFDKHMPDLNWKNHEVQQSVVDIAKYWVNKGIDGLRLDAFIHISKADFEQDFPEQDSDRDYPLAESFYANRPEVQTYLRFFASELRKIKPDLFIMGEASSADVNLAVDYSDPVKQLCDTVITFRNFADDRKNSINGVPENFQPAPIDVPELRKKMAIWQTNLENISYPTLYWSNHDMARVITRYGSTKYDKNSAKALAVAMYLQKGLPIIYYGEEIGLSNMFIENTVDFEDLTVPEFIKDAKNAGVSESKALDMLNKTHKMSARNAMQWTEKGDYHGFSGARPWKYGKANDVSVESEEKDSDSVLNFYRKILQIKQERIFNEGTEVVLNLKEDSVFGYKRKLTDEQAIILVNLSDKKSSIDTSEISESSERLQQIINQNNVSITNQKIIMPSWSSIVLKG